MVFLVHDNGSKTSIVVDDPIPPIVITPTTPTPPISPISPSSTSSISGPKKISSSE